METRTLEPHYGRAILTFGVLSLVLACFPLGLVAWFAARDDLRAMDEGRRDPSGRNLVVAGQVCGAISVVLSAIALVVGLLGALG